MLEAIRHNLTNGNLKFVILMDAMAELLKDLITYVNQNSRFDIYAVELDAGASLVPGLTNDFTEYKLSVAESWDGVG